jgi:succinoglycan biosynthesis protein ExoM
MKPLTAMSNAPRHISVCICTYKRPVLLKRLLDKLRDQPTQGLFDYSIVVTDNDELRSAESSVSDFAATSKIKIRYCVEPQQNISLARNKAIENSSGDLIAFLDDDEFPTDNWLLDLFKTLSQYAVSGVLGPVRRHFDETPPKWIVKGNFYEREILPTGSILRWEDGRTGNVLFERAIIAAEPQPFDPKFRGGEDTDFFRRMIERHHKFVWSAEAIAFEVVPPLRWRRGFILRRALLRGAVTLENPNFGVRDVLRSLVAVAIYSISLPFALILGQHRFMVVLVKLCDHLGKLLGLVGINPIRGPYVTQ